MSTIAATPAPDYSTWPRRACQGMDINVFFPPREQMHRRNTAKAICKACPALETCAAYAMSVWDLYGVWAATTEGERRRIRKARNDEDLRTAAAARRLGCKPLEEGEPA